MLSNIPIGTMVAYAYTVSTDAPTPRDGLIRPGLSRRHLAWCSRTARTPHSLTRWWLRLTAALGFAGAGFHALGVARNMGGWRNWRQNVLNGPPIPAPPSFTGLALAGLAALGLLEEHPDD